MYSLRNSGDGEQMLNVGVTFALTFESMAAAITAEYGFQLCTIYWRKREPNLDIIKKRMPSKRAAVGLARAALHEQGSDTFYVVDRNNLYDVKQAVLDRLNELWKKE